VSPKSKPRKKRARTPIPVRAARNGSDLCLQCGMCCDGTLFSTATITEDERAFTTSIGLRVVERGDDTIGFEEPCPHFVGGCCSIYERKKPAVCSGFRCGVLVGYEKGLVSLEEALDIVDLVRVAVRRLELAMGLPAGGFTANALQQQLDRLPAPEESADHQDLLVPLLQLSQLGVRYFGWSSPTSRTVEAAAEVAGSQVVPDAAIEPAADPAAANSC